MDLRGAGQRLDVHLAGVRTGTLERRGPDRYRFHYAPELVAAHGAIPLSLSLPIREEPFTPSETKPFFEGLLPEGGVRATIARSLRLSEENGFGLLAELGAECAGAVAVLPEGRAPSPPGAGAVRWLDDAQLAQLVADLPRHPLGISAGGDVRLSLGGVQQKLLLVRDAAGRFGQPLGGAPSTHLLKPAHQDDWDDIVANEAFCMRVAAGSGLRTAPIEPIGVAGRPALLVTRFDRTTDEAGRTVRLHQEDTCQALGRLPSAKYEVEGGPSLAEVFQLLRDSGGPATARDLNDLLLLTLVNWLLGNSDAHGKNLALLYEDGDAPRLAPAYDLVSTAVYDVSTAMAMRIGGVEEPAEVDLAAWRRMGAECGLGPQLPRQLERHVATVLSQVAAVRDVARAEGWDRPVIDRIVAVAHARAARLRA